MKKLISSLFLFVTFFLNSYSQEILTPLNFVPRFAVKDLHFEVGEYTSVPYFFDKSNFISISKGSSIIKNDLRDYNKYIGGEESGAIQSFLIGIKIRSKSKTSYRNNMRLRLGFNYYSPVVSELTYQKTDRFRYDTLTSSSSGQQIFLDSIEKTTYSFSNSIEQLRLSAAINFFTDEASRWSFYGGVGLSAGFTINQLTTIFYSKQTSVDFYILNTNFQSNNTKFESEQFANESQFVWSVFSSGGIDFRIGKKRKFWIPIHLYFEIKPTLDYINLTSSLTTTDTQILRYFGIRYTLK